MTSTIGNPAFRNFVSLSRGTRSYAFFFFFVDREKAYDRVPRDKPWKVLPEYGVDGQLLHAIKSFYCRPEVCVRVNGKQSKPFHVGVGLR